jgi:DNA-binding transcriptional MocR family regulator
MPSEHKQQIVDLADDNDIALIEDDIYGELYFGVQRPRSLYSYCETGRVIQCSSFSKNLSRDLRLGWMAPGKYRDAVLRAKLATTMAVPQVLQQGLSHYIGEGGFDRHLRRKRNQYRDRSRELMELIQIHLPMAKRCSQPQGGLVLWLELPECVDTVELYNIARKEGIVLTPGRLFTAQARYQNFLRISYAHPWTEARREALRRLGEWVCESLSKTLL